MKINQIGKALKLCRASKVTMALVGTSGVGKTSILKQVAEELGYNQVIILRPSVIADVGDLIGLPDFEVTILEDGSKETRTSFRSPDWLPKEGDKAMVVIDEINRTQKDITMAMFDLIEADHPKIGNYLLPSDTLVVATLNPPTDNYTVLDFKDSAFTSRLCFVKVVPNLKTFTDWGKKDDNLSDEMMTFLNKNPKFFGSGEDFEVDDFFGSDDVERGAHIKNNNRSKKKVSDLYTQSKALKTPKGVAFECMRGLAGLEFTTAYMNFADTYSNVVLLEDIIADDTAHERFDYKAIAHTAKVLDDLKEEIKAGKIKKKSIDNLNNFLQKVPLDTFKGFASFLADIHGEDKEAKNLEKFVGWLDKKTELLERIAYTIEASIEEATEEVAEETKEEKEA